MALPPAMVVKALSLAADPKVQKGALLAFDWLRRRTEKPAEPAGAPGPTVESLVAELPTREDLALALAQIQARIDASEKRQRRLTVAVAAAQVVALGLLVALI